MSNGYDDLVQAQIELSKRPKKKHTKLIVFLLLISLGVTTYYLLSFYFTHVRHDSVITEYVYKGREIERFSNIKPSSMKCRSAEGWRSQSASERFFSGDSERKETDRKGIVLYECSDSTEHLENQSFTIYSNASMHEFYIWATTVAENQTSSFTDGTSNVVQIIWVWDAEQQTLEPLFSFYKLPLLDSGERYSLAECYRISADDFFSYSNVTWKDLDSISRELLFNNFFPLYFDSNPDSGYSMGDLGDISIVEGTHKEAPEDFDVYPGL